MTLTRAWRERPDILLAVCVALEVVLLLDISIAGAQLNAGHSVGQRLGWTLLDLFLIYRISRGGRTAWAVLLALLVLPLAAVVFGTAGWIGWYGSGIVILVVAETTLLLSPAVRGHLFAPRIIAPS